MIWLFIFMYLIHIPLSVIGLFLFKKIEEDTWSILDIIVFILLCIIPFVNWVGICMLLDRLDWSWITEKRF